MRRLTAHHVLVGVEKPIAAIAERLLPHFQEIGTAWRALLRDRLKLDPSSVRALAGLRLDSQFETLQSGDLQQYIGWLESQGQALERRSIPMERAIAALALYFEACAPFLDEGAHKIPGVALVRFASISELSLVLGFLQRRQEQWNALETRLIDAEQRLRRFSVHLVNAYEQSGRRIARDLHDEIGHNLLVLKLYLELMNVDLKEGHPDHVSAKLDEAVTLISHAIDGVRRLAFNLGPASLEEAGFVPTLQRYARLFTERTGIKTHFTAQLTMKLPSILEVTLYRVLQGALSNVVEHSRARNVRINLQARRGNLRMTIQDDGRGFDVRKRLSDPHQAFGLLTMRQRIELLGGKLKVNSQTRLGRQKAGTRIEVELPSEVIEAA
jgi:signal transduction histidine kinase